MLPLLISTKYLVWCTMVYTYLNTSVLETSTAVIFSVYAPITSDERHA